MRMHFADGAIDVDLDASLRLLAVSGARRIGEGSKNGKESKIAKRAKSPFCLFCIPSASKQFDPCRRRSAAERRLPLARLEIIYDASHCVAHGFPPAQMDFS